MNLDVDNFIDDLVYESTVEEKPAKQITAIGPNKLVDPPTIALYRQRLAEVISAGNCKEYLGKHLTLEQLGQMPEKELVKAYSIYESKLGLKMTKSLGHSILGLYTSIVSNFFPVDSQEKLTEDLRNDPLITESLSSITAQLYFRYGSILAPLAATMITYGHIKKLSNKNNNANSNIVINDGNRSATDRNTDSNYTGTDSNYTATDSNYTATDSNETGSSN